MMKNKQLTARISLIAISLVTILNALSIANQLQPVAHAEVRQFTESNPVNDPNLDTPSPCDINDEQIPSDIAMDEAGNYTVVWEDGGCDGIGNGTGIWKQTYNRVEMPTNPTNPTYPVGTNVQVNTTITGDQKNPRIAMNKVGNYVVVWEGEGGGDTDGIFMRAFSADGTPAGSELLINTTTTGVQDQAAVAMSFDSDGTAVAVVTWHGEGTGDTDGVFTQLVDVTFGLSSTLIGTETRVNSFTSGDQKSPAVAMNNFGEYTVTWDGPGSGYPDDEIWIQAYDDDGTAWSTNLRTNNTTPANEPSIAADKSSAGPTTIVPGGKFVVTYTAGVGSHIYGKTIDRCSIGGCTPDTVELNIDTSASYTQMYSRVAMDYLGNFTVVWANLVTPTNRVSAQSYDYNGRRLGSEFTVNTNDVDSNSRPSIAMDLDGDYIITWSLSNVGSYDVVYQRFITDSFKAYVDTNFTQTNEMLVNTDTNSFTENAVSTAIAPNGLHAIVWNGKDEGSGEIGVFLSLYDESEQVVVSNVRVDTSTDNSATNPAVSFFKDTGAEAGRLVVVWEGTDPADPTNNGINVLYREYNASGTPETSPAVINGSQTNDDNRQFPDVDAGFYRNSLNTVVDHFAVDWLYTNSSGKAIEGAYHDATAGSPFTIVTLDSDANPSRINGCDANCDGPKVAVNPNSSGDDSVVYTWTNSDDVTPTNNNKGVYISEATGPTLQGSSLRVNNTTTNDQSSPDVSFIGADHYIVTWLNCNNGLCDGPSIYGSHYTGDFTGTPPTVSDDDFSIAAPGADVVSHSFPRVASTTGSTSFLVTWTRESTVSSTSFREIFGKYYRIDPSLTSLGVGFRINSTITGNQLLAAVDMNKDGRAIVAWEGEMSFGGNDETAGVASQFLRNPLFSSANPELETTGIQTIAPGGESLIIPSTIEFPNATASTSMSSFSTREVDENPANDQPLYFEVADLDGDGTPFNVTISSEDFVYTDPDTSLEYTIPAENVEIKNYDGNHITPAPVDCETSFETVDGSSSDFHLDSDTCDFAGLNTAKTLLVVDGTAVGRVRFFPVFRLTIDPFTPPGDYAGTITITKQ